MKPLLSILLISLLSFYSVSLQKNSNMKPYKNKPKKNYQFQSDRIPEFFDSRVNFSGCIHLTDNYSSCGSDFAIAAASMLSDRLCIQTNQKYNFLLSAQEIINCDVDETQCKGNGEDVFDFLTLHGIPSNDCVHYTNIGPGQCNEKSCTNTSISYIPYKCNPESVATLTNPYDIKREIMANGPVYAEFDLYDDFEGYHSGVYFRMSSKIIGTKAVKIFGWGSENANYYWICANNKGYRWGEEGYFRISISEVNIAAKAYFCNPQLTESMIN